MKMLPPERRGFHLTVLQETGLSTDGSARDGLSIDGSAMKGERL